MISLPQAVILAGGLGKRLLSVAPSLPKPMVVVRGQPFLFYLIDMLRAQGFTHFFLSVGHLHQVITDFFKDGSHLDVHISYAIEPHPMGTGGAIQRALPQLDQTFFIFNGDTFLPIDYRMVYQSYLQKNFPAMMVLYENQFPQLEKSNVDIHKDRIVAYAKKPSSSMNHLDAGVSIMQKTLFHTFPSNEVFSLEEKVFPILAQQQCFTYYLTKERFYDVGTPERLKLFEEYVIHRDLVKA